MLTPEQREARKKGIGGSDVAAILGLSPYKSAVDVWLKKTGRSNDDVSSEAAYWGNVLEDVVAAEFEKRRNTKVHKVEKTQTHPQHAWALGNIDRRTADGILECKTAGLRMRDHWFEDGESVPISYQAQCMWYMAVTDAPVCDVAALIGGQEYVERRIERDDAVIEHMIEIAAEFWHKHVLADIPPPPRNTFECNKVFKSGNGMAIDADVDLRADIQRLRMARVLLRQAEDSVHTAETAVKSRMGQAPAIMLDGKPAVTWSSPADRTVTYWDKAFADLATHVSPIVSERIRAAHTHTLASSRRFCVKF